MQTKSVQTNLLYFYSEGAPNDNALNLTANKKILTDAAEGHVDKIIGYTPKKLVSLGYADYVKEYEKTGLVSSNPGMSKIGFAAWRPLILLLELEKMNDGDVLIYRDANIKRYPSLGDYKDIKTVSQNLLDICGFDFFIAHHDQAVKNKEIVKTNILRELGEGHPFSFEAPALMAGFVVVRKSLISIDLLNEWLKGCENDEWINGEQYGELDDDFKHSTGEQSVLTTIIANWIRKRKHNIPLQYPFISFRGGRNIKKIKYRTDNSHLLLITDKVFELEVAPKYMESLSVKNVGLFALAYLKLFRDKKAYQLYRSLHSLNKKNINIEEKYLYFRSKIGKC